MIYKSNTNHKDSNWWLKYQIPQISSSMKSHSKVFKCSFTKYPVPCFFPFLNLPLYVIPSDNSICFPSPSATPYYPFSPSYWLPLNSLSSILSILNFYYFMINSSKKVCIIFSYFSFSCSITDFLFTIYLFFLPVSISISSNKRGVSSSIRPKTL